MTPLKLKTTFYTQTSLLSYRDSELENWKFACSKFIYDTCQIADNKGADQSKHIAGWSAPLLFANPEDRFSFDFDLEVT